MKPERKRFLITALLLLFAVCAIEAATEKPRKKKNTEEVTFSVSLVCHTCVNTIERNIPWEKGVKKVEVDLPAKKVKVVYDTRKTSPETLKKALEALEFESVSADEKELVDPA